MEFKGALFCLNLLGVILFLNQKENPKIMFFKKSEWRSKVLCFVFFFLVFDNRFFVLLIPLGVIFFLLTSNKGYYQAKKEEEKKQRAIGIVFPF